MQVYGSTYSLSFSFLLQRQQRQAFLSNGPKTPGKRYLCKSLTVLSKINISQPCEDTDVPEILNGPEKPEPAPASLQWFLTIFKQIGKFINLFNCWIKARSSQGALRLYACIFLFLFFLGAP